MTGINKIVRISYLSILIFLCCFVNYAYCDVGLPLIFITLPAMILAFLPVFLAEAFVYKKFLDINYFIALKASFVSNLISTIAGVPLSWFLLLGVQMSSLAVMAKNTLLANNMWYQVLQNAWIGGSDKIEFFRAITIGLAVSYFLSVIIEYQIIKRFFRTVDKEEVKKSTWKANLITYEALFLVFIMLFIKEFKVLEPSLGIWIFAIFILMAGMVITNFILLFTKNKLEKAMLYSNLGFAAAFLFLFSVSLMLVFGDVKPEGIILNKTSKLGQVLPDTKWVNSSQQIFYNDLDQYFSSLYAIRVSGAEPRKIIDRFSGLGWIPSSNNLYVNGDKDLYQLNPEGSLEKICPVGQYFRVEWSPKGDKFVSVETIEDTNRDGIIGWGDENRIFLFNRTAQVKEEIDFDKEAQYFGSIRWDKSGDLVYLTHKKVLSPNDARYILSSYNVNTKEMRQIAETKSLEGKREIIMEDYVSKENLFYPDQIYLLSAGYSAWKLDAYPDNKNIKFLIGRGHILYIQKGHEPPHKIFESKYKKSDVVIHDLYWLDDRFIILNLSAYLCILDTETEKIGILTRGNSPVWAKREPVRWTEYK